MKHVKYTPRHALSLFLLPLQSSRGWPRYHHRQRLCHFHHPHHRLHILWCKWDIINANNDANEDRNALMISCIRKEKWGFINALTERLTEVICEYIYKWISIYMRGWHVVWSICTLFKLWRWKRSFEYWTACHHSLPKYSLCLSCANSIKCFE